MLAGVAAATIGLAWALRRCDRGTDSLARVLDAGVLRVGCAIEPPYVQLQRDGMLDGESPGVVRAVARAMQVEPQWVLTRFERLIVELEQDRFDVVAAGLFVNPERARRVRFSRPTLRVRAGWLTVAGNPKRLGPYAQLRKARDTRVAVLAGSVEAAAVAAMRLPAGRVIAVPDAQSGLAAVSQGSADALALSMPSVLHMAATSGGRLAAVPADQAGAGPADRTALAFRRDDAALQQAVDAVLASYIGSAGHLALLLRFGMGADDLPGAEDD